MGEIENGGGVMRLKLLSALEGWSFAEKHRLPDYLIDDLDKTVELLSAEVLK